MTDNQNDQYSSYSTDPRDLRPLSPQNRPFMGLGIRWVGALVVVALGLGVLSYAFGWIGAGAQVVSPDNVREQFTLAYDRHESLKAIAGNVCDAQALVDNETDPGLKAQRQDQLTGQIQNYRRIAADYDAAYDNAFQAKHVGPGDLPHPAPSVEEAQQLYCE